MIALMKRALEFLGLLDNFGNFSLTNIALIAVLAKIIFSQDATFADSTALLITVLNYCHKRYEASKAVAKAQEVSDTNMVSLQNQIDQIKADHETVSKLAEEGKKLLSQTNLAMGFQSRTQVTRPRQ